MANQDNHSRRRYSPPQQQRHNNNNNYNGNDRSSGGAKKLKQEDHQASRTLFVGNLPGDIRQSELMKTFEQYGAIEGVDIKLVNEGVAAYAFVVFVVSFFEQI
jgi:RNA recognition motif-containing protein